MKQISRLAGAVAAVVSAFLALAVGSLVAAITDVVSPLNAVGGEFIDHTPRWLHDWAIEQFGTNDKAVLKLGMWVTIFVFAAVLGALAVRRPWIGAVGFGVFGLVGAFVAVNRPASSAGAAIPPLIGAAVGGAVLYFIVRPRPIEIPGESRVPLGWDRRRFLVSTSVALGGAVVVSTSAKAIENRRTAELTKSAGKPLDAGTVPSGPVDTAPPVPAGAEVDPNTPFVTPNDDFYRIDTALSFPRASPDSWSFDIEGMVDSPQTISYADLLGMPQVERMITICCVSNEVGGKLVGNAVWRGVLLRDLLDIAGIQDGAEQVFSTSLDGWTSGFPVEAAIDGRDSMVAIGMNGTSLPLEHGFPARLIVPGLYGYVSATKWLSKIELTTWDREGYWVPRGWSQQGPIKTQSRIGFPRSRSSITPGPTKIAGVAWAQNKGVAKVEVRVDEGPWLVADLATDVSDDAWRQWVLDWDATPGDHVIEVQATDKTGYTQTAERTALAPDGASGHHTIKIKVK